MYISKVASIHITRGVCILFLFYIQWLVRGGIEASATLTYYMEPTVCVQPKENYKMNTCFYLYHGFPSHIDISPQYQTRTIRRWVKLYCQLYCQILCNNYYFSLLSSFSLFITKENCNIILYYSQLLNSCTCISISYTSCLIYIATKIIIISGIATSKSQLPSYRISN